MDNHTQSTDVNYHPLHLPFAPAQLWLGSSGTLEKKAVAWLQKFFCAKNGCQACLTCQQIENKQHYAVIWITPVKNYTLDDLKVIFTTIALARAAHDPLLFIIQKADQLSAACANSLLKSLEEPPSGYHFILLAQRKELVLPTIASRCHITTYDTNEDTGSHQIFFSLFATTTYSSEYTDTLEKMCPSEQESIDLIDQLLIHWITQYKEAILANNTPASTQALRVIALLKQAHATSPMPGSAKLFWKNLFLQMKMH